MSGGGGFRGRGFRPHGQHRQGPGPDLSGGSGCRNSPDPRQGHPICTNWRSDGPDSRLGGGFNVRGGPQSRGPHQNYNYNWSPRGGSLNFQQWRGGGGGGGGGCPPRYNTSPRPFFRGRGQGQYMPRHQFVQTGNYGSNYMQYQQMPEPKPVEQKPAIPHLGSEEERQQKIFEAADALKRKLSSVSKQPAVWRDDEYEAGVTEPSQDEDHDSRITHKGIPELRHDPPELNLTLGDLRDIGRVDHDHRTEQAKINADIDNNFACDEGEIEILAHNPVKPTIEIDLWSDENYTDFGDNDRDNTSINNLGGTNEIERTHNAPRNVFTSPYKFQKFSNNFTSFADDIMVNECKETISSGDHFETNVQQKITPTENIECNSEVTETRLEIDSKLSSDGCENSQQERLVIESNANQNDAEGLKEMAEQMDLPVTASEVDNSEIHVQTQQLDCLSVEQGVKTIENPIEIASENHDQEARELTDNLDKLNVDESKTEAEKEIEAIENENIMEELDEGWVTLSSTTQDDNTIIPGLDGVFENEITNESESAIIDRGLDGNDNISGLQREVVTFVVDEKTKESQKNELTIEKRDETVIERSEVSAQSQSRVSYGKSTRKDDTNKEIRRETPQTSTDEKRDGELSKFGDKTTKEVKPNAIASISLNTTVQKRLEKTAFKIENTLTSETSKEINKKDNREKSQNSDNHNKSDKVVATVDRSEGRIQRDSKNKTDSRDKTEAPTEVDSPNELNKITAKAAADERDDARQKEILADLKNRERRKLVEKMPHGSIGPRSRARVPLDRNYEILTTGNRSQNHGMLSVPADFDPKQPPPNLIANQEPAEIVHIPPAFDPRLSVHDRNALLSTVPIISSAVPVARDFGVNQLYSSRTISNYTTIAPPINYGLPTTQMIVGTSIEKPTNIHPICLSDPYQSLMSMPNVVTPIVLPVDNIMLLPPLPIEPPPPMQPTTQINPEMDDGLEDMQEAMEFAKQLMNMDESGEIINQETSSADTDFFHMPTFPNLPTADLPLPSPLLPDNIPTPPKIDRISVNRSNISNKESKTSKVSINENIIYGPQPMDDEKLINTSFGNKSEDEGLIITDEQIRPKVMFNLSSKTKIINKDNEWLNQHREESADIMSSVNNTSLEFARNWNIKSSPSASVSVASKEKINAANGQQNDKRSLFTGEKINADSSKVNGNSWQIKFEEPKITSRYRQSKEFENNEPSTSKECENSTRKITKDFSSNISTCKTPESLWKNRVIGRFLKMSSRDICNMLNNSSLRKFSIAMKHLVKERRSTLSIGMRNNEDEKLKDSEAAYNREEFMDQISAMLDPNATVDLCNLPTQFIHQLSEVLQLESMTEFETAFTTSDFVETSNSTQQAPIDSRSAQKSIPIQKTRSSTPPLSTLSEKVSTSILPRQIQASSSPRQAQSSSISPKIKRSSTPPMSTLPQKVSTPILSKQKHTSSPSRQAQTSSINSEKSRSSTPPLSTLPQKVSTPILPKQIHTSISPRQPQTSSISLQKIQSSTPMISTLPQKVSTPILPKQKQTSSPSRQSQISSITPQKSRSSTPPLSTLAQKVSTPILPKQISTSPRQKQTSIIQQKIHTSTSPTTDSPRQQQKLNTPRLTTREIPRSSKEKDSTKEIDDRWSTKREREKNSMNSTSAVDTTIASTSQKTPTETRRVTRTCEESEIIEESQKNTATIVNRARRRHQRSTIHDQQETSTAIINGSTSQENLNPVNMADLDDIFSAAIAKTKKTTIDKKSKSEKITVNPLCKEIEKNVTKDPSVDRVERAAVELDKIFAAGIAKAKLASKNAAAAAARAAEANDVDDADPEDDANRKFTDRRSNSDKYRPGPRSFTRHRTRCEKWNQRKARENPDGFRNLTKEEWEAKYGENSDTTYEQEYRAMQAHNSTRSPTSLKDSHESFEEDVAPRGIMTRLGNIVSSDSGPTESWTDSEENRRYKHINDPADYTIGASNNSSEDGSNTSSTSSDSAESSDEEIEENPSVSKLLKVIKAREKIGKKKSINEEIRDEVTAELERKKRERGKILRKGHKSKTKKGHRRKKEKKVKSKERKKRERKRKKRKSRRSGSEERNSSENEDTDDEVSSGLRDQQKQQLLTVEEIKKEDDVLVIKDEPENQIEQTIVTKITPKNTVTMKTTDLLHSVPTKSLAPPETSVTGASISPTHPQMKTKAQLKQLPVLPAKIIAELSKESLKNQKNSIKEISKKNGEKVIEDSVKKPAILLNLADTVSTNSSVQQNVSMSVEVSKSNSKKLDMNAYKERNRIRLHRENEKLRLIHENPSSLTQNLLNIPLKRKNIVDNTETSVEVVEELKDPRLEKNEEPSTGTIVTTAKTSINVAASDTTPTVVTENDKISTISVTIAKTLATITTTVKTPIISTSTTKKPLLRSTKTTKTQVTTTETTKTPAASTTTVKTSTEPTKTVSVTVNRTPESVSLSDSVQQPPIRKLIRRKSLTKPLDTQCSLTEVPVEVCNKFAHIKSEGSKELKLREKLKKGGRQRVSSEGLETTIPSVQPLRAKKRPSITMVKTTEDTISVKEKNEFTKRCEYFKKGIQSDALPDFLAQESLPVFIKEPTITKELLAVQVEIDSLSLPIVELPVWPLEPLISTSITGEIDSDESPPFKGFTKVPILRKDRVLTEAEINTDIDASEAMPLAFEASVDSQPINTLVDLNDLRSSTIVLNEPISYGDEEFVEGRVEIESTLLGFTVTNDITEDSEAIGALDNEKFVVQNIEGSIERFPEESHESLDIIPRVTSTLSDSPAPVDFLITEIHQRESIPSPILVTESLQQEHNLLELPPNFSTNNIEEKRKTININESSGDDAAEVTSSHESHDITTDNVYLNVTHRDFETCSSAISSVAADKEISFSTNANLQNDERKNVNLDEKIYAKSNSENSMESSRNSNLSTVQTPPPQPSSSSDSNEEKIKEIAITKQREVSETRDNETKTKESTHHVRSKSGEHSHGDKSKKKSSRHHSHGLKSKKKSVITEKMVVDAVAANIVKLVPKPTSKETVMARMIEIDVEIHKLMNEKMTLYKMLESGEIPAKEPGDPEYKAIIGDSKTSNETEEIPEIVPLASRLIRNLDKAVLPIPAVVHNENLKKSDVKKVEAEDEKKKSKRKKSPQREGKNRAKDNSSSEDRRQRERLESKSHSRRMTSEESSRTETVSTLSREKSTSSTELGDSDEKKNKRKTKLLQRQSPIRQSSKRSHEHSSKEDLRDSSRESSEQSGKSTKQETRNSVEDNSKSKLKKKSRVLETKKMEETTKPRKEEKKLSVGLKATGKSETSGSKVIIDGERRTIYSDESTLDSMDPEAIQSDEQRGKKEGNSSTGLALLEESFKREMAETRKLRAMGKRNCKKQELQRILNVNNVTHEDDDNSLTDSHENKHDRKTECHAASKSKNKSVNSSEVSDKIWEHMSSVIDAVAENRVGQLYNDDTSSGPEFSATESLPIKYDTLTEKKVEVIAPENMKVTTETVETDKDEFEKAKESTDSKDFEDLSEPVEDEIKKIDAPTEVTDFKDPEKISDATETIFSHEDFQKIPKDNFTSDENTPKSDEAVSVIEDNVDEEKMKISKEQSIKENLVDNDNQQSTIFINIGTDEKEETEEHQLSTTLNESQSVVNKEKEIDEKKTDDKCDDKNADEISTINSIEETMINIERSLPENLQRRSAKSVANDRIRSKSRNGRSVKHRDNSSNSEKQKSVKKEDSSKILEEKPSSRPKSATKRGQREKSTTPNRRSSRYSDDTVKTSRSKKREKSRSRGISPDESEPAKKKINLSQRSSSPPAQAPLNEDENRRRVRKRKRRPEITRDEMTRCKVLLIDCKYTYLSPSMHPTILKKLGISKINPYTAKTRVPEKTVSSNLDRIETPSSLILRKIEETSNIEELSSSSTESPRFLMERELSPIEHPLSSKEAVSSPLESPVPRKELCSSPFESPLSPKESSPYPENFPQSPEESPSTPKQIILSSSEMSNRVEVDEYDDEDDDVFDEPIQIVNVADENLPPPSQSEDEEPVVDIIDGIKDVVDTDDETLAPPDSTADDITDVDDKNIQEADTTDEIEVLEDKSINNDKSSEIHELPESEAEDENLEPRRTRYTVHKGPILDIKVLDDSFLAASEDGAIYRYSQTSNGILNIYKGHEAAVTCIYVLEVAGKSWKLYSGSLDATFRCYDITTGVQDRPPANVGSPVQCMDQAWGVFFVGTKSGHISRYNIKSGSIKGDRLEFSDKSVLALKASSEGPRRILIVASRNQPITIRDALTGLFLRTICGYKNHTVYSLMRERSLVYCGTSSTSIPVFDFTNGEQITQYNAGVGIVCMRLHYQILFAGCYDGNIYVFDTKEPKLICSIPGPGNMLLSMEIVDDKIIAGSKNRQLHSWRMPKQVRSLLNARS